jgi:hypothetical protein
MIYADRRHNIIGDNVFVSAPLLIDTIESPLLLRTFIAEKVENRNPAPG